MRYTLEVAFFRIIYAMLIEQIVGGYKQHCPRNRASLRSFHDDIPLLLNYCFVRSVTFFV